MNQVYLTPYSIVENQNYDVDSKIIIRASDFTGIPYDDGKITFSFVNCRFKKIEIENDESIDFEDISLQFLSCFITEISIDKFITTNCSILFGSSILQGRISSKKLSSVSINNCLLNNSLFLQNLDKVNISFTEENIFPKRWKKLIDSISSNIETFLNEKQSYYIQHSKIIVFNVDEDKNEFRGLYKRSYESKRDFKIGYRFTDDEKKKIQISLNIDYAASIEHNITKIINAKLSSLTLKGFSTGELIVENSNIDNCYIHNFPAQIGSNFYNIKPFRSELVEKKFELHKSNLDKFWFDNVSFNEYSIISLYRIKFGQTTITSCDFPDNFKQFDKFKTLENIHYPERIDNNYYKTRYEIFLQLKKVLESSGNFYESQKLASVSNEALRQIKDLPFGDRLILNINRYSNNHGLSIKEPFIGTLILCAIFYILYLLSIGRIFNSNDIDYNLIGYYFAFLDITHRNDFLANKKDLTGLSVTIDYINKIFVGFLIYQFIAAFRKYGKK